MSSALTQRGLRDNADHVQVSLHLKAIVAAVNRFSHIDLEDILS